MSTSYRVEKDSLGTLKVPSNAYYGVQTARAVENFPISGMLGHPALILAYAGLAIGLFWFTGLLDWVAGLTLSIGQFFGSKWGVHIATYEVPGGSTAHRAQIVRELLAVFGNIVAHQALQTLQALQTRKSRQRIGCRCRRRRRLTQVLIQRGNQSVYVFVWEIGHSP